MDVGKVTQYTLTGIQEGKNCYFAVTAYDANRNESAFSTELECFTLVPAPGVNGAISPSSAVVVSRGMNQTFTVTPAANYAIPMFWLMQHPPDLSATYTFSNVTANHSSAASFAVVSYSHMISASAGANGPISPTGSVSVSQGASQTFTITANTGYQVSKCHCGRRIGRSSSILYLSLMSLPLTPSLPALLAKTYAIALPQEQMVRSAPPAAFRCLKAPARSLPSRQTPTTGIRMSLVDGVSVGAVTIYIL